MKDGPQAEEYARVQRLSRRALSVAGHSHAGDGKVVILIASAIQRRHRGEAGFISGLVGQTIQGIGGGGGDGTVYAAALFKYANKDWM